VGNSLNWINERHEALWLLQYYEHDPVTVPCAPGRLWLFGAGGMNDFVLLENTPPEKIERIQRLFPEARVTTTKEFPRLSQD
jgi:hypothetical protein